MSKEKKYEVEENEQLFFRVSRSGKGIWISNSRIGFGLRGNISHIKDVLRGKRDYAVLQVRSNPHFISAAEIEEAEEIEEDW